MNNIDTFMSNISNLTRDDVSNRIKNSLNKIAIISSCGNKKDPQVSIAYKKYIGSSRKSMNLLTDSTKNFIDHYIISAGYGLIAAEDNIESYDSTFKSLKASEIPIIGHKLRIRYNLDNLIKHNTYDYVIVACGGEYINSLELQTPFVYDNTQIIFMCPSNMKRNPWGSSVHNIFLNVDTREGFNSSFLDLRGKILYNYFLKNSEFNISDFESFVNNGI